MIVDLPTSSVALAVQEVARSQEQGDPDLGRGLVRPDRQGLRADLGALDLRHGRARQRHRQRGRQGGRRHLVLHHRRLRVRPRAGARHRRRWSRKTAARCWARSRRRSTRRISPPSCCRRRPRRRKIIGLANAGGDTINSIKQAAEFGIVEGGQKLAGLLVFLTDVHSLGLKTAHGLQLTEAFYWDQNDETRAWSKQFFEKMKRQPTMVQAGDLRRGHALAGRGQGDRQRSTAPTVIKKMKETPVNDFMTKNGKIREDGRLVRDMYLFEVKKPEESKGDWDLYKLDPHDPRRGSLQAPRRQRMPAGQGVSRLTHNPSPASRERVASDASGEG